MCGNQIFIYTFRKSCWEKIAKLSHPESETATFFLSSTATFVINIGNDNSQQHEILGSILMGWPGKVFSTKSVKHGKRLWKAYSVVFFCFLPFLFLKVDPKEVKCLLQKISKCIKIKPATLRVIIMIVIIDKRFHTRWRIERESCF